MIHGIWTAATGMQAQQMRIDTIANNLANVNTTGFKKSRVDFQDLVYQTSTNPASRMPATRWAGVRPRGREHQALFPRQLQVTNNPCTSPSTTRTMPSAWSTTSSWCTERDGTQAYTRDGSFKLDKDRNIVTSTGSATRCKSRFPPDATDIRIREDGLVLVRRPLSLGAGRSRRHQHCALPQPRRPRGRRKQLGERLAGLWRGHRRPARLGRARRNQTGHARDVERRHRDRDGRMVPPPRSPDTASKVISMADKMMDTANQLSK